MNITYSNEKAFYGDLEEVLNKLLSVSEIRALYNSFFCEVKKAPPKKIKKAEIAAAFINLKKSTEDLYLFVKTLPVATYKAYGLLVWNEFLPVDQVEEDLGFKIVRKIPAKDKW